MKLTQAVKQKPRWSTLIKQKRRQFRETQTEFGARFGVSDVAVSYWERGIYDPPADVTWWLFKGGKR